MIKLKDIDMHQNYFNIYGKKVNGLYLSNKELKCSKEDDITKLSDIYGNLIVEHCNCGFLWNKDHTALKIFELDSYRLKCLTHKPINIKKGEDIIQVNTISVDPENVLVVCDEDEYYDDNMQYFYFIRPLR